MRKYLTIFEEAVSHTLLCNGSISISLHMRKIWFSFLSVNGRVVYNHIHSQEYGYVVCRVYAFHRQQYGSAGCIPFHHQQYEHAGCVPFHCQKYEQTVCVPFNLQQYEHTGCTPFVNDGMSDCPASCQSGTWMNKMPMPEPVLYRNKGTQSNTGEGARMLMPAASKLMTSRGGQPIVILVRYMIVR